MAVLQPVKLLSVDHVLKLPVHEHYNITVTIKICYCNRAERTESELFQKISMYYWQNDTSDFSMTSPHIRFKNIVTALNIQCTHHQVLLKIRMHAFYTMVWSLATETYTKSYAFSCMFHTESRGMSLLLFLQ